MVEITPELVERIVYHVLSQMTSNTGNLQPRVLFLGELSKAGELAQHCSLDTVEEYTSHEDMALYQMVVIGQLSTGQLADLAAGRDETPCASAVTHALLLGKPVYLLPDAPCHRNYKDTANPAFYEMLEGYIQQLEQFGVEQKSVNQLVTSLEGEPPTKEAKPIKWDFGPGLLTADKAKTLTAQSKKTLRFAPGTIITPLARDLLRGRNIEMN